MLQLAWRQDGIPPISNPLESTYERHHSMVFRTAYRITGNAADAEDVLQTVFLRLLSQGDEAGKMDHPESYLRRAAINGSLDVIRRRTPSAGPPDEDSPGVSSNPEVRHALRQALAQLDARHAEMFALRFFEGLSNEEIATTLGMSKLLVAVTLHRTRSRLQKMIQG